MKRGARWLRALVLIVSSGWAQAQSAQSIDIHFDTRTLQMAILDLNFRIEALAGSVQDLRIKETATEIQIELAADVLFDFDQATLLPKAQQALRQAAAVIGAHAKRNVRIEGHTDSKGGDAHNQSLSERRARAVMDWLVVKEGLGRVKFSTQGFGAKRPVAANTRPDGSDDPAGRQKNRRVEIIISKG